MKCKDNKKLISLILLILIAIFNILLSSTTKESSPVFSRLLYIIASLFGGVVTFYGTFEVLFGRAEKTDETKKES